MIRMLIKHLLLFAVGFAAELFGNGGIVSGLEIVAGILCDIPAGATMGIGRISAYIWGVINYPILFLGVIKQEQVWIMAAFYIAIMFFTFLFGLTGYEKYEHRFPDFAQRFVRWYVLRLYRK